MPEKLAVFRFDIDTHVGMRDGVPRLLDMAADLGVPFTFFVNPGRAMSWRHSLRRRARPGPSGAKLGTLSKLGWRGLLETLILNPRVAKSNPRSLRLAQSRGHEIGLHGGRNHASWQNVADTWSAGRVRAEVSWGMGQLVVLGLDPPFSFSSPGWRGSEHLGSVLAELGFTLVADTHGHAAVEIERSPDGLLSVSTNLLGEPGGVGYVSHGLALGESPEQIVERFKREAEGHNTVVVYDHPVVAGRRGLKIVAAMIEAGHERGFHWTTMSGLAETRTGESAQSQLRDGDNG
jgi:peptidoglycan/xylan/chitin deacetylase (PgdA/CDA1 family)